MVVHDTSNLNLSNKHKHNMTKMIDLIVKYQINKNVKKYLK